MKAWQECALAIGTVISVLKSSVLLAPSALALLTRAGVMGGTQSIQAFSRLYLVRVE